MTAAERAILDDLLEAEAASERRAEAARRGAETKRANEAKRAASVAKLRRTKGLPPERAPVSVPKKKKSQGRDRSSAAKAGHAKKKATARKRQRFFVNSEDENAGPGERLTGEHVVTLYDMLHPEHGVHEEKEKWLHQVRPYFGRRVKLTVNGERRDDDGGKISRVYIQRVGMVNSYADVFGSDGLYYRVMKAIFDADSDGEIFATSLTFAFADDGDEDGENFNVGDNE